MKKNIIREELENGTVPSLLVHVGTTYSYSTPDDELAKALMAQSLGANIISDASVGPQCRETIKKLCRNIDLPVTCLPGYILATENGGAKLKKDLCKNEILEVIEELLEMGVAGITIHSAFQHKHIHLLENSNRVFPFTSRMGGYILQYMKETGKENPFYVYFDDILKLVKKYNAVMSLGVALRSPSIVNDGGFDTLMKTEIDSASPLIKRCLDNNVAITLEAGGHMTIDKLYELDTYIKGNCHNVPLRVLTLLTDRGMGHDNVAGAIAAAFLCKTNTRIICLLTRAEHIGQPTLEDIKEAIINYKIALSCIYPDADSEYIVAKNRALGGCHIKSVIDNVIDPLGAYDECVKRMSKDTNSSDIDLTKCTMCGDSCPIKNISVPV